MKNVKIFALAAVAAFGLASCSNEIDENTPKGGQSSGEAYLSIKVKQTEQTRAGSTEEPGSTAENLLSSLYLITLDAGNAVLNIPGGSASYISIADPAGVNPTPEPVKISATAKKLVVIANPGAKLLARLNNMGAGTPWATVNAAIEAAAINEITSDTKGFTMITAGEVPTTITPLPVATTIPTDVNKHTDPFVDLTGKVFEIVATEAEAKALAEAAPVTVRLERLASKLNVAVATTVAKPASSSFTFLKWTVDAVNTTFSPYANKVILAGTHVANGTDPLVYVNNFYTEDPNFAELMTGTPPTATYHPGLSYGKADKDATPAYEPKLAQDQVWNDAGTPVGYVIENTMAANAQRFGSATRLVIKATYYPAGFSATDGDWFQWANENFTFETLQAAYAEAAALATPTESPLYNACEAFLVKVKAVKPELASVANFGALTKDDIASIQNGGDVVKNGTAPVIRWYKNGLNYYYYEIRHDNERDGRMLFGKYGVVRNNSYKLTLNKVNGAGTPWYPDLVNPGDGDPKPEDPIDDATGFLGISVETNPWILWETGFEI